MARINLLPWREERRKQKQKEFYNMTAAAALFMVLILILVHMEYSGRIDYQVQRNKMLKEEISKVESQIEEISTLGEERRQLEKRMNIIEQLQRDRPAVVHLFDELIKLVPNGLYFDVVEQKDGELKIGGVAQSNARVSALMRALDRSEWFAEPNLEVIKANSGARDRSRRFQLKVDLITGPEGEG